ncbi:MAG: Na+/H+ antiporter NhaA [Alphaproteobacteria bacterium]|nr:Na+/H+ antiporter NhaA [Alphaproteobacteria bacterium]
MAAAPARKPRSLLREFMAGEAAGGIVLMAAAAAALIVANSPAAPWYFGALKSYVGPLSLSHWINDALMAVFFLLVGLEIKREFVDGQLSTWPRRILPGVAALGGMAAPALIYAALNWSNPETLGGWAIPTATDIAFALGVLALLGSRVPVSLKVFLTALAIIDDLGAVIIIAIFYTSGISVAFLAAAAAILTVLIALNLLGVLRLWIYLLLGAALWFCVLKSGVHATIAGVALALTIPLRMRPGAIDDLHGSPLHRLEHALHSVVPFIVVPVFGFANAGVQLTNIPAAAFVDPLTLGVALGLVAGKLVGVFGFAALTIKLRLADMPAHATWMQLLGVALLCGIGFTMSLFVSLLAFADAPALQDEAKLGILGGSLIAGLAGWTILRLQKPPARAATAPPS